MVQELAASSPGTILAIDLDRGVSELVDAQARFAIHLPPTAREAFLSGEWDATALLLSDEAAIDRTAARLPYLR